MTSPLSVSVASAAATRHLDVRDLSFTKDARGGDRSANFTLPEWVQASGPELGPQSKVMVDDTATGRRVWEGNQELPGRTVDDSGHIWAMGAVGSAAVLDDRHRGYHAISQNYGDWKQGYQSNPQMTATASTHPRTDNDALLFSIPRGVAVVSDGDRTTANFDMFKETGQRCGGFSFNVAAGIGDLKWRTEMVLLGDPSGEQRAKFRNFSKVPSGLITGEASVDFQRQHDVFRIRIRKDSGGATNMTDDNHWAAVTALRVSALRRGLDGTDAFGTGTYTSDWVLAHDVVIDALWHFTNQVDIVRATIDKTFTHHIDQLSYPDGVRLSDMLDDLALLEPDLLWRVGPADQVEKHWFELGRWPTTPRYEADTSGGWSQPGGELDLSNSVELRWTDRRGREQSKTYTTSVPELDQWARTRDADPVRLGDEVGSENAADRIAAGILAQIITVPFSGTLTVDRPVRDLLTGGVAWPWEIEPGHLVAVRDLDGPPMRLTEMSYRDSDGAAALTLGTPVLTTEDLVATMHRSRTRHGGGRT